MSYEEIRAALDEAVANIVGLPAIVSENVINQPKAGTPFTRTTLMPARPNVLTVGVSGRDEKQGLYQVDLYYPVGVTAYDPAANADLVVAAFPRTWEVSISGTTLRVVQCWPEVGRQVNNWYTLPVRLAWSCIT